MGVFLVDNKGFSYWTASSDAIKSSKSKEPKKEKPAPAEYVKPLAVAQKDKIEEIYPFITAKDFFEDTYKVSIFIYFFSNFRT